jgi:hypothetical protein
MRGLLVGDGYVSRESKRIVDFLIYFFSIYALYYSSNQKKKFKLSIVLDKRVFSFVWDAQMHACLRDNNQRSIFKENISTGFLFINYLSLLFILPYVFSLLIRLCNFKKSSLFLLRQEWSFLFFSYFFPFCLTDM